MAVRKLRDRWSVDFHSEGVRYRVRSPANSRAGAMAYEQVLRQRLAHGLKIGEADDGMPKSLTFQEASDQWFSTYVTTNIKPSVQREYRKILVQHLLPRFGRRQLRSLTTLDIEQFKAVHTKRGLQPSTVNNYLIVLSSLFTKARDFRWILTPPRIEWLKVPPQPFDFLSSEESARLLSANLGSRWHDMIFCGLRTGMRVGELLALQWDDLSLQGRVITVSRSLVRGVEGSPKNNRIRHIPMTADLVRMFEQSERRHPYIFGQSDGSPSTLPMATRGLLTACKRAGLRKIGWHVLRHTFASQLSLAGVPLTAIQPLLGHATIQMTMRYSHLQPSAIASFVQVLDGRNGHPVVTPG